WIDAGSLRLNGPSDEVVNLYEAEMASEVRSATSSPDSGQKPIRSKGRFASWEAEEMLGGRGHRIATLGQVTITVVVHIAEPIVKGHYGMALRNHDQQVLWATAIESLRLEVGEHEFCHTFPLLPLRPGLYNWLTTLYDEGQLIDWWECTPEMAVT